MPKTEGNISTELTARLSILARQKESHSHSLEAIRAREPGTMKGCLAHDCQDTEY
jgi:hypothetical protein